MKPLPLAERYWLLPHLRERDKQSEPEPAKNVDRIMREPPICEAEAAAVRAKLEQAA